MYRAQENGFELKTEDDIVWVSTQEEELQGIRETTGDSIAGEHGRRAGWGKGGCGARQEVKDADVVRCV